MSETTVLPECPECQSGMIRSYSNTTVVQGIEQIALEADGPAVYAWGDSDVWYETAVLDHYECAACGHESDELADFAGTPITYPNHMMRVEFRRVPTRYGDEFKSVLFFLDCDNKADHTTLVQVETLEACVADATDIVETMLDADDWVAMPTFSMNLWPAVRPGGV